MASRIIQMNKRCGEGRHSNAIKKKSKSCVFFPAQLNVFPLTKCEFVSINTLVRCKCVVLQKKQVFQNLTKNFGPLVDRINEFFRGRAMESIEGWCDFWVEKKTQKFYGNLKGKQPCATNSPKEMCRPYERDFCSLRDISRNCLWRSIPKCSI